MFGMRFGQARRDGEQVVVPLQLEEPGNLADDKVARRQAKRRAFCVGVFRIEEWLQVEAAWDARVVVRLADAGGEVLVAHRVGDGDEVVGHPPGETLGTAEQGVGRPTLKRAERRAVDRVDDLRHAGALGCQAPDEAGLPAVRVDDVRPKRRKRALELPVGEPVA